MKAAVLHAVGDERVEIRDDVTTADLGPRDVRVKVRASGVCHSDLSAMNGTLPQMVPLVLGHEGAGEVVQVGDAVTSVQPGDHAIACWLPACGSCKFCIAGQPNLCMVYVLQSFTDPKFRLGDAPVFGMSGTGTFSEELVLPEAGVIKIADDVPFDVAALIGCGVMTGVGSVINTAKVRPGDSVLVVGCGGVGISVIQGARLSGAAEIVAVDMVDKKLAWARDFGATHAVTPEELPQVVQELTGGDGFDYGFEVVGRSQTIRTTLDAVRRGGTLVVVGAGRADDMVQFSAFELLFAEKTIKGSVYGGVDVRRDYDRMISLWRSGRLDLERMITRRLVLDDLNDAFSALEGGNELRQVLDFA